MKQAVVTGPWKIEYREVENPVIKPGKVIIKVKKIGICGSDIHVFRGKHPLVKFPLVQGHEFSGYIHEVGEGVDNIKKGDLVTVEPAIGCGTCSKCRKGLIAQCENLLFIGGALEGAGSEYFIVDAAQVVKMPEGTDLDDAAMVEPLAVAVHAARRIPSIGGRDILIVGGGTIGNLTAQVAKIFGAGNVLISDIIEERNIISRKCGLIAINPVRIDIDAEILRITGNKKVYGTFECVGKQAALDTCLKYTERGGYIAVLGVYEEPPKVDMISVQDKEFNMLGSLMYTWEDYLEAVELIAQKKINLKILRTHQFPFDKWADAYNLLNEKPEEAIKVIIEID